MLEERIRFLERDAAARAERDRHLDVTLAELRGEVTKLTTTFSEGRGAVRILTGAFLLVTGIITAVSHFLSSK